MARPKRAWEPHGLYHVFSRGSDRRRIVVDDRDLADLEHLLLDALVVTGVEELAWALMPNHWHGLFRCPDDPRACRHSCSASTIAIPCGRISAGIDGLPLREPLRLCRAAEGGAAALDAALPRQEPARGRARPVARGGAMDVVPGDGRPRPRPGRAPGRPGPACSTTTSTSRGCAMPTSSAARAAPPAVVASGRGAGGVAQAENGVRHHWPFKPGGRRARRRSSRTRSRGRACRRRRRSSHPGDARHRVPGA